MNGWTRSGRFLRWPSLRNTRDTFPAAPALQDILVGGSHRPEFLEFRRDFYKVRVHASRLSRAGCCSTGCRLCAGTLRSHRFGEATSCPSQRIPDSGYPISAWSISVQNTTCAAAKRALASAMVWRFNLPSWQFNSNDVPTRFAPPGWSRCKQLGLWVTAHNWDDDSVVGSINRCTGSGGRVLRFNWGHTARWRVHLVGCTQSCLVTPTRD